MHPTPWGRSVLLCLLAAVLVLTPAAVSSAHSALIGSNPQTGSTVEALPEQLELRFNESVSDISPAMVLRRDGQSVATLAPRVDGPRLLADAPAETLPDGRYTLVWRIVSADGHPLDGVVSFTLGDGTAPATAAPTQREATEVSSTSRTGALALGGLAAVVLVAAVITLVRRSRTHTPHDKDTTA
ncbi:MULTISPECIES: copper resistance protein CopC [unclassified Aeromicrobium]|uniref:copper resistance CopC family protein n=1 Tax=unclassified Aeromicrobium TaxID=2633570 RepID=UPI00288B5EDC|nr:MULTISPECIES: copper resistance protein CopC [unclassified Aeromicrobium]